MVLALLLVTLFSDEVLKVNSTIRTIMPILDYPKFVFTGSWHALHLRFGSSTWRLWIG